MVTDRNLWSKSGQPQSANTSHNFIAGRSDRSLLCSIHASENWRRSWALRSLLQPLHALLPGNDRNGSRNKSDRVLPILRDHASALLLSDRRMGVRRTRQDLAYLLHLDACRCLGATCRHTRNWILGRNHRHGLGRKQFRRESFHSPFPSKAGSRRSHVFWTLCQNCPVWPPRLVALSLRRSTHSNQRSTFSCDDWEWGICHRSHSPWNPSIWISG